MNVKNVHKCFPKSEGTQRGHMRSQQQSVHSARPAPLRDNTKDGHLTTAEPKQLDFIAKVYNVKKPCTLTKLANSPRPPSAATNIKCASMK